MNSLFETARKPQLPRRQQGLSIIEIMVALVLGALITLGLVQVFTSNSQSFRMNEATARAQEAGRIATDLLSRSIRNARYYGCLLEEPFNNLDTTDSDYDAFIHEFGLDRGVFASSADRPAAALSGTDWLSLSGARSGGVSVQSTAQVNSVVFEVNVNHPALVTGTIIMLSDCANADIFQLTSDATALGGGDFRLQANSGGSVSPGNDFTGNAPPGCSSGANCFSSVYAPGAQVLFPFNETYFVGTGASGSGALFLIDGLFNPAAVELVDGIEDMQIRFREGTTWRENPDTVSNWTAVTATEISLLVKAGPDNLLEQPLTTCYPGWSDCTGGNNFAAPDSALYRVYTFTTAIRN